MNMAIKEILEIIIIPIILAVLAIAWPFILRIYKRIAFKNLIFRELGEISPFPEKIESGEWWEHQKKEFIHQKIFENPSANIDFILSLNPNIVYYVTQLWDAKKNRDKKQWLYYLEKLSDPKFDKKGKIREAYESWNKLFGN